MSIGLNSNSGPAHGIGDKGNYIFANIDHSSKIYKKPEDNPLSNANLPGGIFTHPNC